MNNELLKIWCETLDISLEEWESIEKNSSIEVDSLTAIMFIVNVEEAFEVELSEEMFLETDKNILNLVEAELKRMCVL